MYTLAKLIQCIFPLIALILLVAGIKKNAVNYIISSLWLSVIALILHLQFSGNQILGNYFNYTNAASYSLGILILIIALTYIMKHLLSDARLAQYGRHLISLLMSVAGFFIITNIWINAHFVENKLQGTPVMQVVLFDKPGYCHYKHIFYIVRADNTVSYLCPNYYGLIPSTGLLAKRPDFINRHLSLMYNHQRPVINKDGINSL